MLQGLVLCLAGVAIITISIFIMISKYHCGQHYHVTGPSVVSSGSRSRTVFRGASRDFHPRPNSQVFVNFSPLPPLSLTIIITTCALKEFDRFSEG